MLNHRSDHSFFGVLVVTLVCVGFVWLTLHIYVFRRKHVLTENVSQTLSNNRRFDKPSGAAW